MVENFKVISFDFNSYSHHVSEISWFILLKPFSMALMVPSIGQIVLCSDTQCVVFVFKAVVKIFEFLFGSLKSITCKSVVFSSITWVTFGLLLEQFFLFFKR